MCGSSLRCRGSNRALWGWHWADALGMHQGDPGRAVPWAGPDGPLGLDEDALEELPDLLSLSCAYIYACRLCML